MNDDDDLPVLTQVLRRGRIPQRTPAWPEDSASLIAAAPAAPSPWAAPVAATPPRLSDMPIVGDPMSASLAAAWPDADAQPATDYLIDASTDPATDPAKTVAQVELTSDFPDTISPDLSKSVASGLPAPATLAEAELDPEPTIDLDALEDTLRATIIKDLQSRIDSVVTQRITENLEPLLQRNMAALADEIRDSIHATLHDVVRRAVAQEVSRLQARNLH